MGFRSHWFLNKVVVKSDSFKRFFLFVWRLEEWIKNQKPLSEKWAHKTIRVNTIPFNNGDFFWKPKNVAVKSA